MEKINKPILAKYPDPKQFLVKPDRNELTCPITANGRQVPCGKCNRCLKRRKNDWSFRLKWETKVAKTASFITLTYDQKHVRYSTDGKLKYQTLSHEDLIRFHKSVRKANERYFKDQGCETSDYPIRYYSVGEYGTRTRRPHYHCIMFNVHPEITRRIDRIWGKGFVKIGEVNEKTIAYTAKYVIDIDDRMNNVPVESPFSIMSKNLGLNYVQSNKDWHKTEDDTPEEWRTFVLNGKYKQAMPRYYKEKIFDEVEREIIGEKVAKEQAAKHVEEMKEAEKIGQDKYINIQHKKEHKNLEIKMKSQLTNKL